MKLQAISRSLLATGMKHILVIATNQHNDDNYEPILFLNAKKEKVRLSDAGPLVIYEANHAVYNTTKTRARFVPCFYPDGKPLVLPLARKLMSKVKSENASTDKILAQYALDAYDEYNQLVSGDGRLDMFLKRCPQTNQSSDLHEALLLQRKRGSVM